MKELTKIDFVIDMLEILQSELEVMSADEIYNILEDAIILLAMSEENA